MPADKAFIDEYQQALWQQRQAAQVVTPTRANMLPPEEAATGQEDQTVAQAD